MNSAIRWMTENHVAANLLMLVFIVGGLILGFTVKQEVFPEINLDRVMISVAYPGAGPEEVEEGVILKIEENLTSVDGIKQLKSTAAEGYGSVVAEVTNEADVDLVLQEIKSEVDRITTFPRDTEKPVVSKMLNRREVLSIIVFGELPERSLRELAEQVAKIRVAEDVFLAVALVESRVAELVVLGSLVRIRKDRIGFGDFFELLFRQLVVRIAIRVIFLGQLAVGFFYAVRVGFAIDAED